MLEALFEFSPKYVNLIEVMQFDQKIYLIFMSIASIFMNFGPLFA